MKYCTKCPTRAPDSAEKCRTCDGPLVLYEDLRASDLEKISTDCCPNPECDELVAPPQQYFCKACGKPLKPISLDVWIEKVLEPTFVKKPLDLMASRPLSLFRSADEMGLEPREVRKAIGKFIAARAGVDQSEVNEWLQAATAYLISRESDLEHLKGYARKLAGDRKIAPDFANRMLDALVGASRTVKIPSQHRTRNQPQQQPAQEASMKAGNYDENIKTKPFIDQSPNTTTNEGAKVLGRDPSETNSPQSRDIHQSGPSKSEGARTNGFNSTAENNKNSERLNRKESDTELTAQKSWFTPLKYVVLVGIFLIAGFLVLMIVRPQSTTPPPPTPTPVRSTPTPAASPVEPPVPEGMVLIKAGEFYMGNDNGRSVEGPSHLEPVEKAFWIDKYEVSNRDYQKCVDNQNCEPPARWDNDHYPSDTGKLPVTRITFQDAANYCRKQGSRLPTEIEWEYAARGNDRNRIYPWGPEWIPHRANVAEGRLTSVGSYQPQRDDLELYDLIGNAQEWTSSKWVDYPGTKRPNRKLSEDDNVRVIRGGSCKTDEKDKKDKTSPVTATYRQALKINEPKDVYSETGFRCVQDVSN